MFLVYIASFSFTLLIFDKNKYFKSKIDFFELIKGKMFNIVLLKIIFKNNLLAC